MFCININGVTCFVSVVDSQAIDREATIPDDVLQQLKDLGMFGLQIPQDYGKHCFAYLMHSFAIHVNVVV